MTAETRPLLVALHGFAARGAFFDDLALRLADCCDVIAPDFIGHGTLQQDEDVSIERLAEQINFIMELQNARPIFLLGWSMGAAAALAYLARYESEHIAGLIIEDMAPKPLHGADWAFGIGEGYRQRHVDATIRQIREGWALYGRKVWRATFASALVAKEYEQSPLFEAFLDNREAALENAWRSLMAFDARDVVTGLDLPILAIMGKESQVYGPGLSDWYDANLQKGDVCRLSGVGHAPHLEQPAAFANCVASFIQRLR